jgi:hypothetical protein
MDASTIDREFEQLQGEFRDVATAVAALATKMQAAEKAGDANATEWLGDLKQVAQEVDEEQAQVQTLLLAIHDFIGGVAQAQQTASAAAGEGKPPLFAPGHEPEADEAAQQPQPQRHHMFGGYYGGGFGQAMEMGMAMSLGANLVGSIFR